MRHIEKIRSGEAKEYYNTNKEHITGAVFNYLAGRGEVIYHNELMTTLTYLEPDVINYALADLEDQKRIQVLAEGSGVRSKGKGYKAIKQ